MGVGKLRRRGCRMRYWKDSHLARSDACSLEGEAFHGAGDGSTATHHEMVPRGAGYSAPGSRLPNRWRPQRRGIKRTHWSKRSPPAHPTDRTRRPADNAERLAASEAVQINSRAMAITM